MDRKNLMKKSGGAMKRSDSKESIMSTTSIKSTSTVKSQRVRFNFNLHSINNK